MSLSMQQRTTQVNPSERINLMWPEDYITVDSGDQLVPVNQDGTFDEECQQECGEGGGPKKRILFRPQVTVNVFSTGGSGAGGSGSGVGGHGTGGAATINNGNGTAAGDGTEPATGSLAAELAALSERVDQLSRARATPRLLFDSGMWSTMKVRSWQQPRPHTNERITFSKRFERAPMVTVSVSSADVANNSNLRLKVYATDIDSKGFTVHADTWGGTTLYSCGVSWTAIGE